MGGTYDSMSAVWRFVWPGLAFVAATVVALLLRALLLSVIRRWARPPNGWASLAQAIRLPSILWAIVVRLRGVGALIERASERRALGRPVTGLGQTVARGVVFIVGGLVLLAALGIQITPI